MLAIALLLAVASPEPPPPPGTTTVVAGKKYEAGPLHRLVLGRDYRDLWAAPVTVPVLDLTDLTPTRRVGGQQTRGLAFRSGDGRSWTFRSVDKDPSEILPADLHDTIADRIVEDQIAASHPGGAVVASVITRAAGVLTTHPRLVALPDEPALGEFRETFGGLVGTFEEYPQPGYAGATEIVDHVEMWKRMQASPADRVDARALLRARLVDILVGDWDRHRKQWRWARVPGRTEWQPIAEDRDQAFSRYEGLLLDVARNSQPRFVSFDDDYPSIEGLTWNGWEMDRQLLTPLPRQAFETTAREVQAAVTDAVIDEAVAQLPGEWRRIDGERLGKALRARRNALAREAIAYYEHLAGEVDVHATDQPDEVDVEASAGTVRVAVRAPGASEPWWSRTFDARETKEVRLHLAGGDDRVTVRGTPAVDVRAIGGPGDDVFSGVQRASDHEGTSRVEAGARLDDRPYEPPPGPVRAPWIPARDWGRRTTPLLWGTGGPDVGVFLGGGFVTRGYGFRKHPWADEQVFRAGYAIGARTFRAEYRGTFRLQNSDRMLTLNARASGIDILRFYGLGNDTTDDQDDEFYRVRQQQFELSPGVEYGTRLRWRLAPTVQYTSTRDDADRLIGQTIPYGAEDFLQVGVEAGIALDTRDRPVHPSRGVRLAVGSRVFPALGDVDTGFAVVRLDGAGYVSLGGSPHAPVVALRAGLVGSDENAPFHELAFVGAENVRGLRPQRYAGTTAYWGGVDLRQALGRVTLLVPGELGIVAFADAGRVETSGLKDESADWHTGVGGGLWFAVLGRQNTVSLSVARSEGRLAVVAGFGLGF